MKRKKKSGANLGFNQNVKILEKIEKNGQFLTFALKVTLLKYYSIYYWT